MAVAKMTMVTLSGPKNMVDTAIRRCVINKEIHPVSAVSAMSHLSRLTPFDTANPCAKALSEAYEIFEHLEISPRYNGFEDKGYGEDDTLAYFGALSSRIRELDERLRKNLVITEDNDRISTDLLHIQGVDEQLRNMLDMKYLKFRFGRIHKEDFEDCLARMRERGDVFFINTGAEKEWIYGIYVVLPGAADTVDTIFASMEFERIRIAENTDVIGTAGDTILLLEEHTRAAKEELAQIRSELDGLRRDCDELLSRYSYLRFLSEAYDLRSFAGCRHNTFFITGWVPKKLASSYAEECESIPGFVCLLTDAREWGGGMEPPVKMGTSILTRVFTPFLEMYGLPLYKEADPSLFLAVTYTLLFGIMFGDVGQGVVLSLIGLLMWKKRNMWLGRVLAVVGISSTAFGFVYGSVFGFEDLLPGFKVLEDGNAMTMLVISIALGVALQLICMLLNTANGIRQRDLGKIFFSPNGLPGIAIYAGIGSGVVAMFLLDINLFSPVYIILLVVVPLLAIMAAEPLTKLIERRPDWKPKSIGGFFVEGFFELFETVLSFISNTISFLRVGAFAISHAGMMLVVMQMSGDGSSIPVLIIGNLIVMFIEAALVCIQVMRLEFYEMFGRFYGGGGKRFSPRTVEYSKPGTH